MKSENVMETVVGFLVAVLVGTAGAAGLKTEEAAFQAQIDAAAARGGGRVVVPAGRHVVGPLYLRSGVELHLEEGALLEGVPDRRRYKPHVLPNSEGSWSAVVMAFGVTNVAITGRGEIFGNGAKFENLKVPGGCSEGSRPRGVFFADSARIRLEGFLLRDAACWGVVFKCCDGVEVRRLRIDSVANVNNDGLDIEARNVLVEDCEIDTGDDAICVKSNDPQFCVENVLVRNCRVSSHCSALKIGTASHGAIRNVRFENCRVTVPKRVYRDLIPMPADLSTWPHVPGAPGYLCGPGICGICVTCVDGGIVEDIAYDGISMNEVVVPVFLRGGMRLRRSCGIPPSTNRVFRNVVLSNIRGTSSQSLPSTITGVEGCRPKGVTLRNVDIACRGEGTSSLPTAVPGPEFAGQYPDARMFSRLRLPAYGLLVDQADDVVLENVRFTLRPGKGDGRPAVAGKVRMARQD